MRSLQFRALLMLSIAGVVGCSASPTPTPIRIATEAATEPSILAFEIADLADVQSISLSTADDGSIYLVQGQGHSLFVSRSGDGGRTFSDPVLATGEIPVHVLPIERPAIAADGDGRVAIAWLEMPPDFHGANIWYATSQDGGEAFNPGRLVATEPEGEVAMVQVALDGEGNPVLTWLNDSDLRFSRSLDGGSTFTDAISIGEGSCECCQPEAMVIDEALHIAYRSLEPGNEKGDIRDIVMIHSSDGGATFEPVSRVSDAHWYLPACPIAGPSIAIRSGDLFVAWMDGRAEPPGSFTRGDIWLASSEDGGYTFSPNIRINPDQEMHHTLPTIAIGPGGRIHVAWEVQAPDTRQAFLYYTFSDDGGQTFAAPHELADNSDSTRGNPGKPVLVVDNTGNAMLGWLDRQGARLATWTDNK